MHTISSSLSSPPLSFAADKPWLAPLAGHSDLAFRLLCKEYGAAVTCTEMVSAKGLIYGMRSSKPTALVSGTEALLATCPEDTPLVVQLFGAEPEFLGEAVQYLRTRGFMYFDLNMGCSVLKVTKTGAGASLLRDIPHALRVARAMIDNSLPGTVGVKLRLGWHMGEVVCHSLAKELEQLGAGWVSLHPRYAKQGFTGQPDYTHLRTLGQAVTIPVIASGDLFTAAAGAACLASTGVSTVMFARGALSNPGIFAEYCNVLHGRPASLEDNGHLVGMIRRHAALLRQHTPQGVNKQGVCQALAKMRIATPRYVKHVAGARQLRAALALCHDWDAFFLLLDTFFLE